MIESIFLKDWDEIRTKMAKRGHLLPKSGINSELVNIQRVKKKVIGDYPSGVSPIIVTCYFLRFA